MVLAMLAPAKNMVEPVDFLELPITGAYEHDVPGWNELERYLQATCNLTIDWPVGEFRRLYNHYLKRFPVHYFSEKSIPEIDFALYIPVNRQRMGINHTNYLILLKTKFQPLKIARRKIGSHIKSRKNFHFLTHKIIAEGLRGLDVHDVREVETICNNTETLYKYRSAKFHGFLSRAERKFHKTRYRKFFKDKWPDIKKFLDERDRLYLETLIERIKTEHLSFEAAHIAAKICGSRNLVLYNWIAGGDGREALRNRMQVTEAFPWLASMLSDVHERDHRTIQRRNANGSITYIGIHADPTYKDIEKAIDRGDELIPALQEAFSDSNATRPIRASTVRKMLGLRIADSHQNLSVLGKTLQGIDRYAPDIVLQPGYFDRIAYAAENGEGSYAYLNSSFYEILGAMGPEERDNFFKSEPVTNAYGNTQHFLSEVYRKLVLPYFTAKAIEYGVSVSDMAERYIKGDLDKDSFISRNQGQIRHPPHLRPFGNISFMNMVRLSESWHDKENQRRYVWRRYAVETLPSDVRWPALTEEVTAPNGVKIIPRTSQSQLMEEWEDMNHCIHGFAPNCLGLQTEKRFANAHVFSHIFKMASNKTRATLGMFEVHPIGGGKPALHIDHVENRRTRHDVENHASEKAPETVAAKWFFNQIAEGKIKIDWERINRERREMRTGRKVDNIFIEIGFDPSDAMKREQAYLALRAYLPERFRTASYAEWVYKMGFEEEARLLLKEPMGPNNNPYRLNHVYVNEPKFA